MQELEKAQGSLLEHNGWKKKNKRLVTDGIAHINASFNNTIVMITDMGGNAFVGQHQVDKDSRDQEKSTPFAAQIAAERAGINGKRYGYD